MFDFRTDLAIERRDIYNKANNVKDDIDGIRTQEEKINDKIKVTRVEILNKAGEDAIGKKKGNYVTIDIKDLKYGIEEDKKNAADILKVELNKLIKDKIKNDDHVLVVGLGNEYITPDALGPKVISEIDVTRHIKTYMPQYIDENARTISAISPGVLGNTGIETLEVLKGIVENIKPKLMIVIDALASKSISRISSTIQISDTGIVPGAGIGNKRKELTFETLGIPVVAIGIPTVVNLATVTNDCLDIFIEKLQNEAKSNDTLNKLKEMDNYQEIYNALDVGNLNMIVTPKEIDELIENMKDVVSGGINDCL